MIFWEPSLLKRLKILDCWVPVTYIKFCFGNTGIVFFNILILISELDNNLSRFAMTFFFLWFFTRNNMKKCTELIWILSKILDSKALWGEKKIGRSYFSIISIKLEKYKSRFYKSESKLRGLIIGQNFGLNPWFR